MKTTAKNIVILGILTSSLFPMRVKSQETDSSKLTPPPRPYVAELKGNYSLAETIVHKPLPPSSTAAAEATNAADTPKPGPAMVGFESIQTGAVRKDKHFFADGTSSEIWRSNALRFILRPENPNEVVVVSYQLSDYKDPGDFDELKWVGVSFYKGEQQLDDHKCYFYKQGDQSAWIDETTHWPVAYDSPLIHVTYAFSTPETTLELPANISKKVQQMRRAWAGLPAQ